MGYQFVHIETYGRKATPPRVSKKTGQEMKRKKGQGTVATVLAEAAREPAASTHVANPQAPELVYGISVEEARDLHDARLDGAKTTLSNGKQRAVRVDQQTLMTAVASYPDTWSDIRGNADAERNLAHWEALNVEWFRRQFGDALVSIVRHVDEDHPHLHVIALPGDLHARRLHPGFRAKEAERAKAVAVGHDMQAVNAMGDRAYMAACRAMQDSYWNDVGIPCGLARLGPGRRRLTRGDWQREQAAAQNTARLLGDAVDAQAAVTAAKGAVTALAERGQAWKGYADRAREAARRAEAAEKVARMRAAEALRQARAQAAVVVADAEAKAARLERVGATFGGAWAGFRGVERRLKEAADGRVRAARARARGEVTEARKAAKAEMAGELAELRRRAEVAESQAVEVRRQMEAERARRIVAEGQKDQAVRHQAALADRLNGLDVEKGRGIRR